MNCLSHISVSSARKSDKTLVCGETVMKLAYIVGLLGADQEFILKQTNPEFKLRSLRSPTAHRSLY